MKKNLQKYSFILLLFSIAIVSYGQSNRYRVSLLTCDPGNELYTTFGHSALRLVDSLTQRDLVFNYGTFNYNTDNFYVKFMRGKLPYTLSYSWKDSFLSDYIHEQRTVREQVLNLDSLEVEAMIAFLSENTKPENREYRYDFFFDNCSTRLDDLLVHAIKDSIDYGPIVGSNLSYRDLLDQNLVYMPWSDFGIDLVIGAIADQKTDLKGQMYIPSYLSLYYANAKTSSKKIVAKESIMLDYEKEEAIRNQKSWFTPLLVFVVVLLLTILFSVYYLQGKNPLIAKILDISMLSMAGLIGTIICLLWFATDHMATRQNWNIIWLNPLYFLLIPLVYKTDFASIKKYLAYALILANIACLLLWAVIPQNFHIVFVPMMLSFILILVKHTILNKNIAKSISS